MYCLLLLNPHRFVVQTLALDLGIRDVKVLANKVRTEKERDFIQAKFEDNDLLGIIRFNEKFLDEALHEDGGLITGSGVLPEIQAVLEQLEILKQKR